MSYENRGKLLTLVLILVGLGVVAGMLTHRSTRAGATWEPVARVAQAGGMVRPPREADLLVAAQATGRTSARMALAFLVLPFGATIAAAVALALLHRRRARAEEALSPGAPLADGPTVVFGVVEDEPGAAPPVVVRIHQVGSERCNKGVWSHTWTETKRDVEARPFTLVRADGARVRVEPDARVVLHESFVRFALHSFTSRERIAEIVPGAEVHVTGELTGAGAAAHGGAYRGSGALPVLRPPRTGPMVIADEPVGETDRRRMRFHALAATALAAGFMAAAAITMPYPALVVDGTRVLARPTEVGTWKTWYKPKNGTGRWITHYGVRAEGTLPSGTIVALEDECSGLMYDCAKSGRCAEAPFVVSARWPDRQQIGEHPTLPSGMIALLIMLGLGAGGGYPLAAMSTRPWYARRKVNDSGKGRLDGSA